MVVVPLAKDGPLGLFRSLAPVRTVFRVDKLDVRNSFSEDELQPCPFCGERAVVPNDVSVSFCFACGVVLTQVTRPDEPETEEPAPTSPDEEEEGITPPEPATLPEEPDVDVPEPERLRRAS
jgi:hypothetical protein